MRRWRRALFILALGAPLTLHAAPADSSGTSGSKLCPVNPSVMKAHFELSATGQRKLLDAALKKALAEPNFQEVPRTFRFGAESKLCTRELVRANPSSYAWERCYGPPYVLISKNPADQRDKSWADKPEPSTFEFSRFSLRGASFGPEIVSCARRSCKVRVPVRHLEVGFDFRMKSIYESCYTAGLQDVGFTLRAGAKESPYLESEFRFGDQDQTARLVPGSPKVVFPAGTLTSKSTLMRGGPKAVADRKLKLCPWSDQELMATITQQLLKEKLKDQFVLDLVTEKLATAVFEPLESRLAQTLERIPPIGGDLKVMANLPEIGKPSNPRSEEQLSLLLAVEKTSSTLDALPFLLNVCVSCYRTGVPGSEGAFSGFSAKQVAGADLAIHASYLALNRVLDFGQKSGRLDFCLVDKKVSGCDSTGARGSDWDRVRFLAPPTMGWSQEKQSFFVDAPRLQYETNHGTLSHIGPQVLLNARVYGKFEMPAGGRVIAGQQPKLRFTATSADVRGASFSKGDVWGLASSVADSVVKLSLGRGAVVNAVKDAATQDLDAPDIGLSDVRIAARPDGLEVYSNLDDPGKLIPWLKAPSGQSIP